MRHRIRLSGASQEVPQPEPLTKTTRFPYIRSSGPEYSGLCQHNVSGGLKVILPHVIGVFCLLGPGVGLVLLWDEVEGIPFLLQEMIHSLFSHAIPGVL